MRKALILITTSLLMSFPAQAQFGPIEDILEDIIIVDKNGHPSHGYSVVETIPVNVDIETLRDLGGYSLVLNAYKPVQPGMKQPELIGQTRILLTGMPKDFGLAIMVPDSVTRDLDFAVINGAILDSNNQEILVSRQEEFYRGRGTVALEMIEPGSRGQSPQSSPTPAKMLKLEGKAYLPSSAPELSRGASMTVELVEVDRSGLAGGGVSETIISQTFVDLDKEKSPFKFKLEYPDTTSSSGKEIILRAFVMDWAGRRLYEDFRGQPFRGKDDNYKINLTPSYQP